MRSVTIRILRDEVHRATRVRAARRCQSVKAELRDILQWCRSRSARRPMHVSSRGSMPRHWIRCSGRRLPSPSFPPPWRRRPKAAGATSSMRPSSGRCCHRLPGAFCRSMPPARRPARRRWRAGGGIGTADALIAAIARANGLTAATRDASQFVAAGRHVIDAWKEGPTRRPRDEAHSR